MRAGSTRASVKKEHKKLSSVNKKLRNFLCHFFIILEFLKVKFFACFRTNYMKKMALVALVRFESVVENPYVTTKFSKYWDENDNVIKMKRNHFCFFFFFQETESLFLNNFGFFDACVLFF